jgi:hypothetical protein
MKFNLSVKSRMPSISCVTSGISESPCEFCVTNGPMPSNRCTFSSIVSYCNKYRSTLSACISCCVSIYKRIDNNNKSFDFIFPLLVFFVHFFFILCLKNYYSNGRIIIIVMLCTYGTKFSKVTTTKMVR